MSKTNKIVVSGTGLFTPTESITNEELVASFNEYVEQHNRLQAGKTEPLRYSTSDFIIKASGIEKRYVMEKSGILDINRMKPRFHKRADDSDSLQCEIAVLAAKNAFEEARISTNDIDTVIVSCSNIQRPYPAIAVEVQNALGIDGTAYDMNAGCASAVFAIQTAYDSLYAKNSKGVLIVNPEIMSGQVNFCDRDSHFIFGDAASAIILQRIEDCKNEHAFVILGSKLKTQFSNNIRNNFGFLSHCQDNAVNVLQSEQFFSQQGRKVFKEVIPFVSDLVLNHLSTLNISSNQLKRLWLHQANANMNRMIATKILNREPTAAEAPTILNEYANTSSAGTVIAFNKYHRDLKSGDIGIFCAFGAGYSAGNIVLQKV